MRLLFGRINLLVAMAVAAAMQRPRTVDRKKKVLSVEYPTGFIAML